MQYTPQQILERLQKGLDEHNNVVDDDEVLAVVSILEKFPITKEALEQTKIGRHINELRKKTTNAILAKRAKNLVRGWQKLLTGGTDHGTVVNGERINPIQHRSVTALVSSAASSIGCISPSSRSSLSPSVISKNLYQTPNLSYGKEATVTACVSSPRLQTSTNNSHGALRSNDTPKIRNSSRPTTPNSSKSNLSPKSFIRDRPGTPSNVDCSATPITTVLSCDSHRNIHRSSSQISLSESLISESSNDSFHKTNHSKGIPPQSHDEPASQVSKTDIANRKKTRDDILNSSKKKIKFCSETPNKSGLNGIIKDCSKKPVNISANCIDTNNDLLNSQKQGVGKRKLSPVSQEDLKNKLLKTPKGKVKTTQELIAGLAAKSNLHVSDVVQQISNNRIEKESDVLESIVPAGAKPRPRKKPFSAISSSANIQPPSCSSLSISKTELVEKFLQTSVSPVPSDNGSSFKDEDSKSTDELPWIREYEYAQARLLNNHGSMNTSIHNTDVSNNDPQPVTSEPQNSIPSEEKSPILSLSDAYKLLPPLDLESIVWDNDEAEGMVSSKDSTVTDASIERIHSNSWDCVNGNYNFQGEWQNWMQTLSLTSYDGDLLHILPYVATDD